MALGVAFMALEVAFVAFEVAFMAFEVAFMALEAVITWCTPPFLYRARQIALISPKIFASIQISLIKWRTMSIVMDNSFFFPRHIVAEVIEGLPKLLDDAMFGHHVLDLFLCPLFWGPPLGLYRLHRLHGSWDGVVVQLVRARHSAESIPGLRQRWLRTVYCKYIYM